MTVAANIRIREQIAKLDGELKVKRAEREVLRRSTIQKILDRRKRWEPEEIERSLRETLSSLDEEIFILEGKVLAVQAGHEHQHPMFQWVADPVSPGHERFCIDCHAPWPKR